ncbi:MAG TPA: archaetidylserine decarboxylase [Steroidobacteraceae bacterium]|jgi:phosphatidylserine decarboxylase|nr:archaetidylserine decarboxylase [Steroidobacteraceae bacterium]
MTQQGSAAVAPPTLRARLFVILQYLLPQHALSRLVWHVARSRRVPLKNFLISRFVKRFAPDMSEAQEPAALRYCSFNEFFTRALRADARRIDADPNAIASPVDGTISAIGRIAGDALMQAKDRSYSLTALLAGSAATSARFIDGSFATLYLAPFNYHRIHMPAAGTLRAAWYVPGRLFSVNAATAASVAGLFARNERIVCVFDDASLGFALVLVGALFVGSMSTHWHGDVTPATARRRCELQAAQHAELRLAKGAELGRFNMGSTVILLLPKGVADWLPGLAAGSRVVVGQALARRPAP